MAILTELKDPRVRDVTVTYVEVSPDLRQARVHVSVMGDQSKQKLSLSGLKSAAGYLQSCINTRIDTRYTPRLAFVLDQGVKKSIEISRILREVLPEPSTADAEETEIGKPTTPEIPDAIGGESAQHGDGVEPQMSADQATTDTEKLDGS